MRVNGVVPRADNAVPVTLLMLGALFLRIACTSFGGFMTMVSVTQNAIVVRHKLLLDRDLLDALALASMLPGPIAINVVAYVGYRLRGIAGAVVCVVCAVLPAFLFMVTFGTLYFRWGNLPAVGKAFMGVTPAVAAIVTIAAWRLCQASACGKREALLTALAAALLLSFPSLYMAPAIVAAAAVIGWRWFRKTSLERDIGADHVAVNRAAPPASRTSALFVTAIPLSVLSLIAFEADLLLQLFCTFAGMSLLMFGGGYVFIPLLQQVVVEAHTWVTRKEFIDAIALAQITPGPVVISAAFIGLKVAGVAGAAAATIGMFAPTAALMVAGTQVLKHLQHSPATQAALHGVRAAVAGMVIAAAVGIGKSAAPVYLSGLLFAAALLALTRYRIEAVWVVPAAGLIGLLFY